MTFEEFLEKCRAADGWQVNKWGNVRNSHDHCPLQVLVGPEDGYRHRAQRLGLNAIAIIEAADGATNGKYRKALLGLVKP